MKLFVGFTIFFLVVVGGGILYVQNPQWFSRETPSITTGGNLNSEKTKQSQNTEQKPQTSQNQVTGEVRKETSVITSQAIPTQPQSFSGLTNAQLKAEFEKELPLVCFWKEIYPNNLGSSETTLYYTKNTLKTIVSTSYANNTKFSTHILLTNTLYYQWRDGGNFGLKLDLAKLPESPTRNKTVADFFNSKNPNEVSTMNCSRWVIDNSVFTPPSSIQFVDENSPPELLEKAYESTRQP